MIDFRKIWPLGRRSLKNILYGLWGDFFTGQKQTATGNGGEKMNLNFDKRAVFPLNP